jgi:hypothetical protein
VTWSAPDSTKLPLFVREGGIVPLLADRADTLIERAYLPATSTLATDSGGLDFHVFPHGDSSFTVYDGTALASSMSPDGLSEKLTLTSTARSIRFEVMMTVEVSTVLRDGSALHHAASTAELDSGTEGWIQSGDTVDIRLHFQGGETEISISTSDHPARDASTADGSALDGAPLDGQTLDGASPSVPDSGMSAPPGGGHGGCSCRVDDAKRRGPAGTQTRPVEAGLAWAWAVLAIMSVRGFSAMVRL